MVEKIFLVKTTTERNIRQIAFDHFFNKGDERGISDTLLKLEDFVELTKEVEEKIHEKVMEYGLTRYLSYGQIVHQVFKELKKLEKI